MSSMLDFLFASTPLDVEAWSPALSDCWQNMATPVTILWAELSEHSFHITVMADKLYVSSAIVNLARCRYELTILHSGTKR